MAVTKVRCWPFSNLKSSPLVVSGGSSGGSYTFESRFSYNDLAIANTDKGYMLLFHVENAGANVASDSITANDVDGYAFDGWFTTSSDVSSSSSLSSSSFTSRLTTNNTLSRSTIIHPRKFITVLSLRRKRTSISSAQSIPPFQITLSHSKTGTERHSRHRL